MYITAKKLIEEKRSGYSDLQDMIEKGLLKHVFACNYIGQIAPADMDKIRADKLDKIEHEYLEEKEIFKSYWRNMKNSWNEFLKKKPVCNYLGRTHEALRKEWLDAITREIKSMTSSSWSYKTNFRRAKRKYEEKKAEWDTKESAFKSLCDICLCFYTLEYEDAAKKLTKERMKAA